MTDYVKEIQMNKKAPLSNERKKEAKDLIEKQWKEESKLVTGIFKNIECPGGKAEFPYKKFPQDNIMIYSLEDGKQYDIPLAVAKHINNNCAVPTHKYLVDADGNKIVGTGGKHQRYQFLSKEFM